MKRPSLIPKVVPTRWQSSSAHGSAAFAWTTSELSKAFKVLAKIDLKTKFCFIIDGLDEFDGDHQNLIDMLFSMIRTSNVKVLASSRPWLVFQDAFESSPEMILQDLTHDDIKIFTHESLYNHARFDRLLSLEPERAPKLVTEIVDKASGVFLWVHLVVRSLMEGLTNADRISDLRRRLQELPTDLEQYFFYILTSLDSFYLHQASQLFRLALEARNPLSVLTFSYLDQDDLNFALKSEIKSISEDEEAARCDTIERRLNSRCKGLLESRRRQSCDEYSNSDGVVAERVSYEVDFMHRTVRDFLGTPTVRIKLVASDTPEFNANMTLARAFVAQIKGLRHAPHAESNFQALWDLVFDTLHHLSRVGEEVCSEAQVALLDELDLAAAHFRDVAIVKRGCDPTAHWVNTGYRFGLDPLWNNDLLTLCIQHNLISYTRQKLYPGAPLSRPGKPLLAFAMTRPGFNREGWLQSNDRRMIPYTLPHLEMVELLLDRGANPNEVDGSKTIWDYYLVNLYKFATMPDSAFYKEIEHWFKITRLLLTHGASPQTTCTITVQPGKLGERINLRKESPKVTGTYSALDVIRLIFGGNSRYDVTELEDLLEEQQQHVHSRCTSNSYLQVPGPGLKQDNATRPRSASGSSQNSQASAASWRGQTDQDIVVPLQNSIIRETKQGAGSVAEFVPQKQRKHSRLWSWFGEEKEKEKVSTYAGT